MFLKWFVSRVKTVLFPAFINQTMFISSPFFFCILTFVSLECSTTLSQFLTQYLSLNLSLSTLSLPLTLELSSLNLQSFGSNPGCSVRFQWWSSSLLSFPCLSCNCVEVWVCCAYGWVCINSVCVALLLRIIECTELRVCVNRVCVYIVYIVCVCACVFSCDICMWVKWFCGFNWFW